MRNNDDESRRVGGSSCIEVVQVRWHSSLVTRHSFRFSMRRKPPAKPPLRVFTTTLWEYPSQHYVAGRSTEQGDRDYVGATPSWVIWQLLQRYTRANDLIVDPMCGSGTTMDVARDLGRRGLGYDLAPPFERQRHLPH